MADRTYNLNYPDYTQGFGGYGSYQPAPPPAPDYGGNMVSQGLQGGLSGLSTGNPYMALAGALSGTALGAYGTYKQSQQADKDYEMQLAAWQAEQARQKRLDEEARKQQGVSNNLNAGQYAQGLLKDAYGSYSPWARHG